MKIRRRRSRLAAALLALLAGQSAFAQAVPSAPPDVPSYVVPRATGRVVIDGEASEEAWAKAPVVTLQFLWEHQTGTKQKTEARLLWDDKYLYVFYAAEDEDIVALFSNRDDPTYRDDALEIFINPRPSQESTYYGLEINAGAVLYDYVAVMPRTFYRRFQMQGVQLAVHIRGTRNIRGNKDEGWNLEVAIPFENFDTLSPMPKVGDRWRMQLNRWDGVEPNRRMSIWADPKNDNSWPHNPSRFGWLEFGN